MIKLKILLPVLIAIAIVSTLGVTYTIDLAEEDHDRSFLMTFSAFNATDTTTPDRPRIGDIRITYGSLNYDMFSLFNDAESRETILTFGDPPLGWIATLVDGSTDGETFEFTWLVNHSFGSRNGSTTSEIVVSGKCDVNEIIRPGVTPTITFTTIKGDLTITPSTKPSPPDGLWSNYSSVCQTLE